MSYSIALKESKRAEICLKHPVVGRIWIKNSRLQAEYEALETRSMALV